MIPFSIDIASTVTLKQRSGSWDEELLKLQPSCVVLPSSATLGLIIPCDNNSDDRLLPCRERHPRQPSELRVDMNDDPASSSSARADEPIDRVENAADTLDIPTRSNHVATEASSSRSRAGSLINGRRRRKKNKKKKNPGSAKKLEFVTDLLKSLDTLVFAELSALYYMECSMIRFMLRAAGQYLYLSPKEESLPIVCPVTRGHVLAIVVPNIICLLLHIFGSLSVGADHHRGYLHGGLIIDFIGQMPSTSRLYYVLIDIMLLAVQLLMMTVHNEREKLRVALKTFKPINPTVAADMTIARTIEELDAEERGLGREESSGLGGDETNDIELRPVNSNVTQTSDQADDPESSRGDSQGDGLERANLADVLASGNGVLGDYHMINTIRTAGPRFQDAAAGTLRRIGYEATAVALEARRRRRAQTNGT